jgi:hypothetical protein
MSAPEADPKAREAQVVQHAINNRLTVILANLDLLEAGEMTAANQRQVARIRDATKALDADTRAYLDKQRGRP